MDNMQRRIPNLRLHCGPGAFRKHVNGSPLAAEISEYAYRRVEFVTN